MAIEFNPGDSSQSAYNDPMPPSSKMVRWVMKTGLVHDEKQANYVLLAISVLFFVGTLFVITSKTNSPPQELTPEQQRSVPAKTPIKR